MAKEPVGFWPSPCASQAVNPQSASHQIAAQKMSDEDEFDQDEKDIVGFPRPNRGRSSNRERMGPPQIRVVERLMMDRSERERDASFETHEVPRQTCVRIRHDGL